MSNAPMRCKDKFPKHHSSNTKCIALASNSDVLISITRNAFLPREHPRTSGNIRERPGLGGPGSLDDLGSLGAPESLGDALGGMDHGPGLGIGLELELDGRVMLHGMWKTHFGNATLTLKCKEGQ